MFNRYAHLHTHRTRTPLELEREPLPVPGHGPGRQFLARASYPQAVAWIGACLADALHHAHERGLLHLDLKPSNVLLAFDGQPMLLDFHIAQEPIRPDGGLPEWLGGTPAYMSPEQRAAMQAVSAGRPVPAPLLYREVGMVRYWSEHIFDPAEFDVPPRDAALDTGAILLS